MPTSKRRGRIMWEKGLEPVGINRRLIKGQILGVLKWLEQTVS